MSTEEETKLSPVEGFKIESNYLRGDIAQELVDSNDFFGKSSIQLLKNHGLYQQDDRDARAEKKVAGAKSSKAFSFMIRTKIPGGKLTSAQMLAEMDLCDEVGNTTLRITSRQGLQLHGIIKSDIQRVIRRIDEIQLSTLAACGDVQRNFMCCPAPHNGDPVHAELQALADQLAQHFCPRTKAYHEIWLRDPDNGEESLVGGGEPDYEPIYGPTYLPRKFKTAIGLAGDNCVDLYANDLGLMAICENFKVVGYNVLVGGGMGVTPSAKKTFPAVAKRMAFCTPEQVLDVATAIVMVQRDFGNRADRKIARLKYLINDRGLDWYKAKVEEYAGFKLPDPHPQDVFGFDDHLGWHEQGDGKLYYGLNVENGRIADVDGWRLKAALREICSRLKPNLRLTAHQSILFCDLDPAAKDDLEGILRSHGVKLSHEISNARRWSMACVAWPTCGLAITESERALPGLIDQLEAEVAKLGLSSEVFTVRMTGCPNGCARPYNSDIGIVGKTAGKYTLFVGGRLWGDRLNFIYKDLVPEAEVVHTLVPLFVYFKQAREGSETFGEFCARKGADDLLSWTASFEADRDAGK
ncbi:MAG: NADPH-dependent assimilatory sulfite reductase hemoprotein subunit [Planctomycetaceae bacterium]|nr:NADPH-dependent assimilatory sulfite reductase hemoprotein subunit [Planctomycetaceae bacterium]